MCLTKVEKVYKDEPLVYKKDRVGWKIFAITRRGALRGAAIFYSFRKNRKLSSKGVGYIGSRSDENYEPAFHLFKRKKDAEDTLSVWYNRSDCVVIKVRYNEVVAIGRQYYCDDVIVARKLYISSEDVEVARQGKKK